MRGTYRLAGRGAAEEIDAQEECELGASRADRGITYGGRSPAEGSRISKANGGAIAPDEKVSSSFFDAGDRRKGSESGSAIRSWVNVLGQ